MTTSVKEKPPEKIASSLVSKYALARVTITVTESGIHARAFPALYNQVFNKRRERMLADAGQSVSMQQASDITDAALRQEIASATGLSFSEALTALEAKLKNISNS